MNSNIYNYWLLPSCHSLLPTGYGSIVDHFPFLGSLASAMRAPGSQSINKIVGRTIEWCRLFKILKSCRIVYEHLIIRILYFSRCPEDPPPPNCTIQCDKYIYPILDWEDRPGKDNIKCRPLTKSSFVKNFRSADTRIQISMLI